MANEYLVRRPTSTGNRKVWTVSFWHKRNAITGYNNFYTSQSSTPYLSVANFNANGTIQLCRNESATVTEVNSTSVFKDVGSWMHIMVTWNTTHPTAADRAKLYVNGVLQPTSGTYPTQNYEGGVNRIEAHTIGTVLVGGLPYSPAEAKGELTDYFFIDGQSLTPEVFGFYKDGNGYISAGSTQATDFRNGQWVPRKPNSIISEINANGGFGVNGFYLPMNDSSNFGADFHCPPNSIIKLKGENLPQPRNGAPETTDAYVSQLREDPYAANLVLAVPGISTATGPNLITNGTFDSSTSGWTAVQSTISAVHGNLRIVPNSGVNGGVYQSITTEVGKRYTVFMEVVAAAASFARLHVGTSTNIDSADKYTYTNATSVQNVGVGRYTVSFTPTTTTTIIWLEVGGGSQTQIDFDNVVVKQEDAPRDYSADIKGSGSNKALTANGNAGVGYELDGYYGSALSFTGIAGTYFSLPNSSDLRLGSDDFTIECWVNINSSASDGFIFGAWNVTDSRRSYILWSDNGVLSFNGSSNGSDSSNPDLASSGVTLNQWNHVAVEKKSNVVTLYVNGVAAGIATNTTALYDNTQDNFIIGGEGGGSNREFNGQIQDLRVYKGVAKYTGGFDVPKPYTPVGIATWRAVSDSCQNNFATLNPVDSLSATVSDGNLTTNLTAITGGYQQIKSNFSVTSGKWYWEILAISASASNAYMFGISRTGFIGQYGYWGSSNGWYYYGFNGAKYNGSGAITYGNSYTAGDIIGISLDMDNSEVTFYKNGISQGIAFKNVTGTISPTIGSNTSIVSSVNFGQNPTFSGNTTAGTYTDASGKGLFKYQPPEGFLTLCEDNLPTPAIKDPGEHFKTVLYTGDGNDGRSITGVGFQPDLVWVKRRDVAAIHFIFDSVRGAGKFINSSSSSVEGNDAINTLTSFDLDGFVSGDTAGMNASGNSYVAWCWKSGGPSVVNTDGSIISRVSANQTNGFSIVSYTGSGANATVGHGLGKAPNFILIKSRTAIEGWIVYHSSLGATQFVQLNTTGVASTSSTPFNDISPTSSIFSVGTLTNTNQSGAQLIAYCWSEIDGFSKFGSYVGNGNADGPFVYCGFKPAWVLIKRTDAVEQWIILDSSRSSTNPVNPYLVAQASDIEAGTGGSISVDFLSNGFKLRQTGAAINASGGTYIFAVFAESPFKYANSK